MRCDMRCAADASVCALKNVSCGSAFDTTSRVGEVVVRGRTMERGHQAQEQRNDAQPPVDSFGV